MNSSSYLVTAKPIAEVAPAACGDACGQVCDVEVIHAETVRAARAALPSLHEQAALSRLFALFSNPTRLNLLLALRSAFGAEARELCVCDLEAITGASQSLVSHHLGTLREAKLVTSRRVGRLVYYRLSAGPLAALLDDALRAVRKGAA
ncbi:MAG: transcriptional regulator [Myxococcaceae bacterium]|nr:MAG: transcriptional regulator [Myxococcaceae bacterium]